MHERQEIESALAEGKKILNARPELRRMGIDAVLDELDDGTQEMVHNRWGVAAWMIVESIPDMNIYVLVEHLASKASGLLTDQYVGYLLQKEYHINLELLILEAEKRGQYEKIVRYVLENLQYQEKYEPDNLLSLLEMLEHHYNHNTYWRFLHCYSKHISNCKAFKTVADIISELKTQAQYDMICQLKRLWYRENAVQANEQLSFYVSQQGKWNKQIVIGFIGESLYYDVSVFELYFPQLKMMSIEHSDLWNQMIPVFVEYVRLKEHEEALGDVIEHVLQELERIPDDTEKTKFMFIDSCMRTENFSEHLRRIYQEVISRPFEGKRISYELIDHYYYGQVKNGAIEQSLQDLQTLFRVNDIYAGYSAFFDGFGSTVSELAKCSADMIGYALTCMLANNLDQIFFGMGLFVKIGNFQSYLSKPETERIFLSDAQLVSLMKGLLYYLTSYAYYLYFENHMKQGCADELSAVVNSIVQIFNHYSQVYYPPFDNHAGILTMLYRLFDRLDRTEEVIGLLNELCFYMQVSYCKFKKYPSPVDSFEDAVNIDMGYPAEEYNVSGFWGTMIEWIVLLDQKELYQKIQPFLSEDMSNVTKCGWFLKSEEEVKFYDANAMYSSGTGVAFESYDNFEKVKEEVNMIMNQFASETFSFEEYEFPALEFIVSRYYGTLPRVKKRN